MGLRGCGAVSVITWPRSNFMTSPPQCPTSRPGCSETWPSPTLGSSGAASRILTRTSSPRWSRVWWALASSTGVWPTCPGGSTRSPASRASTSRGTTLVSSIRTAFTGRALRIWISDTTQWSRCQKMHFWDLKATWSHLISRATCSNPFLCRLWEIFKIWRN